MCDAQAADADIYSDPSGPGGSFCGSAAVGFLRSFYIRICKRSGPFGPMTACRNPHLHQFQHSSLTHPHHQLISDKTWKSSQNLDFSHLKIFLS